MRTSSAAAKPYQGDSLKFYLITGSIYTDQRETMVIATIFDEVTKTLPNDTRRNHATFSPITHTGAAKRWVDRLSSEIVDSWDLLKKAFIQRNIDSSSNTEGIAAIVSKLDILGQDMKKLKENVHAIQAGCISDDEREETERAEVSTAVATLNTTLDIRPLP
nr:hypothetical protein [Tanacetum cinerariifolium]